MNKQSFKRLTLGVTAIIALVMMLQPNALSSKTQELSEEQAPEVVEQQAQHIEEPKSQDIAQESDETSDTQPQEESQVPVTTKPVTEEAKEIIEKQKEKGGNATYKDLADLAEHLFGPQRNTTPVDNKDAPVFGSNDKTSIVSRGTDDGKYTTKAASDEIAKEMERLAGKS